MDHNNSKLSKREETTEQSIIKKQPLFCRICLEDLQATQIPDLCLCKGQNSMVHEKCMLQWMRRAQKYIQSSGKYFYHCDICRSKIYLTVQTKYHLRDWQQMQLLHSHTCCTLTATFFFILSTVAVIVSVLFYKSSDVKMANIFGIIGAMILLIIDVVLFIVQIAYQTEVVIHGIEKAIIHKAKGNQIMPLIQTTNDQLEQYKKYNNQNQSSQFILNQFIQ